MKGSIIYRVLVLLFLVCFGVGNVSAKSESEYSKAMKYRAKLSELGVNFAPWKDRLQSDLELMSKLITLSNLEESRFRDYKITSTPGKTFVSKSKKHVFINHRVSTSQLKSFLFEGIKPKVVKKTQQKGKKSKQKQRKSVEGKVIVVDNLFVRYIKLPPKRKVNPYSRFISVK